jgi:protein-S-isoprenylcysteine O-methyltransferase Ste14
MWLALRSILWTCLLPGVFAGFVPLRFFGLAHVPLTLTNPVHLVGLVAIAVGALLLLTCIWEFGHSGRGTLSPVDPPRALVVKGLYRYVRNPMYLSVTVLVLGEVMLTGSRVLFIYWAVWFVAVNVFVTWYEEPTLRRQFGESYERYARDVRRWLPRF